MAQQQLTKTKQDRGEDVVVEEERDTSRTEEVIAECDSCLSEIDDILNEIEDNELPGEPTDEEIYAQGPPDLFDFADGNGGYDWDAFIEAKDRYAAAYEAVTGLSYEGEDEKQGNLAYEMYGDSDSCTC